MSQESQPPARAMNLQTVIASLMSQRTEALRAIAQLQDQIAQLDGIIAAQDAEIAALKASKPSGEG